jgi:adenylylsulfate kinase
MSETRARSVVKSLTWRFTATLTTIALVLLLSGELQLALVVGGSEVIAKLAIFYVHERAWQRVGWGF